MAVIRPFWGRDVGCSEELSLLASKYKQFWK